MVSSVLAGNLHAAWGAPLIFTSILVGGSSCRSQSRASAGQIRHRQGSGRCHAAGGCLSAPCTRGAAAGCPDAPAASGGSEGCSAGGGRSVSYPLHGGTHLAAGSLLGQLHETRCDLLGELQPHTTLYTFLLGAVLQAQKGSCTVLLGRPHVMPGEAEGCGRDEGCLVGCGLSTTTAHRYLSESMQHCEASCHWYVLTWGLTRRSHGLQR